MRQVKKIKMNDDYVFVYYIIDPILDTPEVKMVMYEGVNVMSILSDEQISELDEELYENI